MITDEETTQTAGGTTDAFEIDEFVPRLESVHQDQHPHYSHELPDTVAEAALRVLIRLVPFAYGLLLGGLSDHMYLGLALGTAVSMIADLNMQDHSILRSLAKRVVGYTCSVLTISAHGLAAAIERLGMVPPRAFSEMQCEETHT